MSDRHFSHEVWLSQLRDHLAEERYAARTSRQCLAVARHFLRCLDKQHVDVARCNLRMSKGICNRHNGGIAAAMAIHHITEDGNGSHQRHPHALAPGSGPVATGNASGHACRDFAKRIRREYGEWMGDQRGLAPGTVSHRCAEARRLLDWLGERLT